MATRIKSKDREKESWLLRASVNLAVEEMFPERWREKQEYLDENHYQRESEMETDPVDMEMHIARNMLVGRTHHQKLINQNQVLLAIKREMPHTDPRKREIHELIGKINAKLAQSKLDAANNLIDGIRFEFTAIGRALQENDFVNAREWINWSTLQSLRRQLFEAPSWLVNAIEEVTGATYGSALANFNEVLAAAKDSLVRLEEEQKIANRQALLAAIELQRQKVRDAMLSQVKPHVREETEKLIERLDECIAKRDRKTAGIIISNLYCNMKYGDAIRAIYGEKDPNVVLNRFRDRINQIGVV